MPPFHDLYLYSMVKPPPWLTWITRVPSSHFPAAACVPNSSRWQPESTFAHWRQFMGLLCSNHFHGFPSSLKQKPNSLPCPMKSGVCSAILPSSSCLNSSCIACPPHPPHPCFCYSFWAHQGHSLECSPGTFYSSKDQALPHFHQTCGQLYKTESPCALVFLSPWCSEKTKYVFCYMFSFIFYTYHPKIYAYSFSHYLPPPLQPRDFKLLQYKDLVFSVHCIPKAEKNAWNPISTPSILVQ